MNVLLALSVIAALCGGLQAKALFTRSSESEEVVSVLEEVCEKLKLVEPFAPSCIKQKTCSIDPKVNGKLGLFMEPILEWCAENQPSGNGASSKPKSPTPPASTRPSKRTGSPQPTSPIPPQKRKGPHHPTSPRPSQNQNGAHHPTSPRPSQNQNGAHHPTSPQPSQNQNGAHHPTSPSPPSKRIFKLKQLLKKIMKSMQ